jgi:hypothetical protein
MKIRWHSIPPRGPEMIRHGGNTFIAATRARAREVAP